MKSPKVCPFWLLRIASAVSGQCGLLTVGCGGEPDQVVVSKKLLHPDIVLCLLKDILFVDTPEHDMIYARGTFLATLTWHLRPYLITRQI